MRKVLLWAMVALATLAVLPAARANHANYDYFRDFTHSGDRWNEATTREYCFSPEWWVQLSGNRPDFAYDAAWYAKGEWDANTDMSNIFTSRDVCGDFGFADRWNGTPGSSYSEKYLNFCIEVPDSWKSSVQFDRTDDLEYNPGVYATTIHCDRDSNGYIDYAVIVIGAQNEDKYHFDPSTPPSATHPWDARGIFTHEFGHWFGFDAHMASPCTADTNFETMCVGSFGWNYGSGGATASRTLEEHDIGEMNQPASSGAGY